MRSALAALPGVVTVVSVLLAQGPAPDTLLHLKKGMALLAHGHRVFVRAVPADERATHERIGNLLGGWGRWRVVDNARDADILVRLEVSFTESLVDSATIIATIEDVSSATALCKSLESR